MTGWTLIALIAAVALLSITLVVSNNAIEKVKVLNAKGVIEIYTPASRGFYHYIKIEDIK